MASSRDTDPLGRFTPSVATWFRDVFAEPTEIQVGAWKAISRGENALVVAPTGSGKTLAAFLWAIGSLVEGRHGGSDESRDHVRGDSGGDSGDSGTDSRDRGQAARGVRVLYISPLKALGIDVENNLRAPLTGINRVAARLGREPAEVSVAVRSGDTTPSERARQVRNPPDILITTPESLFLLLTSKAREILGTVDTVIVDEIHALAGTKRGVHLALSLERLERLAGREIQRIGLSATVRPLKTVAQFLGGARPVEIIDPPSRKEWELRVRVPVEDMSDLQDQLVQARDSLFDGPPLDSFDLQDTKEPTDPQAPLSAPESALPPGARESALPTQSSIWPHIEEKVYDEIAGHRSTLVFVNSRRTAERLTSRLNEIHALRHDPESLSPELRRPPAQIMKATDVAGTAPAVIARAHHGSVSKDERATIESMLKEGSLRAVVSTSSLELGIDMGAVEKVIQVESPPSVASGLQRVGRAGHVVGAVSKGSFYPKHRADLLQTAVVVDRMRKGLIEELHVPANALDVLAQHTVAAVAMDDLDVDDWFSTVTAAHPYRGLSRELFDAVIDLVSGTYPSTDFAELRPRVVYDRITGTLSARPGAQRTAVINGGTIPDRGMFGVFLAGGGDAVPRRVGELDEEMVYESRVGDVFTLGASSWRIEQIDRDRVLVTPAPGHTGRLPFWNGDQAGRPAELGKALGAFRRLAATDDAVLEDIGLDPWARDNLTAYLEEQAQATGVIPDERTLVLERFRDELGDWRVVLHSPYGRGVNAAWALAAGAKFSEATGMDAQPVASDDGIVLRVPDSAAEPSSDLFLIDPDEVEAIVAEQVGNSALFASRFRECAARALLLPSRNPGKRAPLWQQRQRSAQLLDVAKQYPKFPIVLEAVRECMQDVYDLPALVELCGNLRERTVRIAEVTTQTASLFATSILFTYTGAFMYEGDGPLAEKRAAALALDPALLNQLLGGVELRDLLDPAIIAEVDADLRRRSDRRKATNAEQLIDALRVLGPVPLAELGLVSEVSAEEAERELGRRIMRVRIAGVEHVAQSLDAALLRDGLGVPVPPGIPVAPDLVPDALEQLVARWARTRGPFTHDDVRDAFGVAASVAHAIVGTLAASKTVVEGRYRQGVDEPEFLAPEVLKTIRSRSLAAARAQTEPVSPSTFGRFLPKWQQVAPVLPAGREPEARGADGVFAVIEQLAGVRLPASAWETLVLPQRVRGYRPSDLDELTANGEVLVVGAGSAGAADPWVKLLPADYAAQLVDVPDAANVADATDSTDGAGPPTLGELQQRILGVLADGGGGGFLFGHIARLVGAEGTGTHADGVGGIAAGGIPAAGAPTATDIREALWSLFELGLVSPDGFAPLRARLSGGSGGRTAHRARRTPARGRLRMGRTSFAQANRAMAPVDMMGRWSTTIDADTSATARSVALGEAWLDRYGVVTRGSVVAEATVGGFALAYRVLSRFEEAGKAMRGMAIDGLGAAQFSTPAVIDRLRGLADTPDVEGWPSGTGSPEVHVLAAVDPANPYGAALPWPERGPTRSAGSLVVLVDGLLAAHLTRGGRTLTVFDPPPGLDHGDVLPLVVGGLEETIGRGMVSRIVVEKVVAGKVGAQAVIGSDWATLLRAAGARITPKGVRIGGAGAGSSGSGSAGARA